MWRLEPSAYSITTATKKARIEEKIFFKRMEKELLEKILKGGITVQGDLVMEKHVENEIGNVEAGGIGIQINHGAQQPQPKKAYDGDADVLSHINTPEAQQLWEKAQDAGWVDAERLPTERLSTKAAKAVLANVMIELLNIPRPGYVPFEALWNVAGLQNSYSSGIDRGVNVVLKKQIKESLR